LVRENCYAPSRVHLWQASARTPLKRQRDARLALRRPQNPEEWPDRRFLDLHALAAARSVSLDALCEHLRVPGDCRCPERAQARIRPASTQPPSRSRLLPSVDGEGVSGSDGYPASGPEVPHAARSERRECPRDDASANQQVFGTLNACGDEPPSLQCLAAGRSVHRLDSDGSIYRRTVSANNVSPAATATYCLPSTAKLIGPLRTAAVSGICHSRRPVRASNA